jgi:hypothetical protein
MSEIKEVTLENKFEVCDACGYTGGFHVIFERTSECEANEVRVRLKCPSCAQVFDLNLYMTIRGE